MEEIGINILSPGHGYMAMTKEIFALMFPKGLFEWCEITDGRSDEQQAPCTLHVD